MKNLRFLTVIAVVTGLLLMHSCNEEFLEITPNGALDAQVLATYEGVDALLIGAYSMIDGVTNGMGSGWQSTSSGWVFGSIRGMEANKGTDTGDQPDINPIQTFTETATNPYLNIKWQVTYEGISRANGTISTAAVALENGTITQAEHDLLVAQARALRGVYHFWAWKLWADRSTGAGIPYMDVDTDAATVTNVDDVRPLIIGDLEAGLVLPTNMSQIGRFNKTVVQVFLAKAQMQMYGDYATANTLLGEVIASGTQPAGGEIGLMDNYGDIFDASMRNEKESVYTVQFSINDNSGAWNAGPGEVLNFPYKSGASPGGCCGFFNPTQDFVNSFNTSGGLPLIDLAAQTYSYNSVFVTNDQGVDINDAYTPFGGELDPRLDWSVGRRGIPYWDWGPHTGADWIRDQTYSGPYSPKKQVYKQEQEGVLTDVGSWTSGYTANGYRMIRYADVLLLKAECEAMTGAFAAAEGHVNEVRARAANAAGFVMLADGVTPAANYVINEYPAGSFTNEAAAMHAIRFERKLELGQEGHRYYDLQRWYGNNIATELQRIMDYEITMPWSNLCYAGQSIGAEDVNFPVPQRQIDVSNNILVQNR